MATKKATPLPHSDDYSIQRVVETVAANERSASSPGLFDDAELVSVEVGAAGEKDVLHKLGKNPSGYILVESDTFLVFRKVSSDENKIRFEFSGATKAKLVLF